MNPIKDNAFLAIQSLLENLAPCEQEVEAKAIDLKEARQLINSEKFNEAKQLLKTTYMKVCQRNDLEDKFIMDDKLNAEIASVEVFICQAKQLMKCRKSEEAEELLKNVFDRDWLVRSWMGMFNVDMVVAEVLICQGKYAQAKERICLKYRNVWENMPDARILLYKAIIHTMLEEKDEAKKNWDEFLTVTDKEENNEEAYKKLIRKGWERLGELGFMTYIDIEPQRLLYRKFYNTYCAMNTVTLAIQSLLENLAPCDKVVDLKKAEHVINQLLIEGGNKKEAEQELNRVYQRNDLPNYLYVKGEFNADMATVELHMAKQLMKCRKSKEAKELLNNAFDEEDERRNWMGKFNLDMAIIEVLICQGKYEEAKERACLETSRIWELMPDTRIPLYKAIVHTMLEENDLAKKNWDEFQRVTEEKENSEEAYKKLIREKWEKLERLIR